MSDIATGFSNELFQQSPIGILFVDLLTGRIHDANGSFCAMIGKKRQSVVGSNFGSFMHPDDKEYLQRIERVLQKKRSRLYHEKRLIREDGTICFAGITVTRRDVVKEIQDTVYVAMVQQLTYFRYMKDVLEKTITEKDYAQDAIFNSMASLSEFRDNETGEHLLRTKSYVRLLLESKPYAHTMPRKAIRLISNAALLHDIGKVGISDSILLKPGSLTSEEFQVMKKHTTLGVQVLKQTSRKMHSEHLLMFAEEIAGFHHERWDGSGYPYGLQKHEIPLPARIMAIADVYDALTSDRPYKKAVSHATALDIICDGSGTHFDPVLVSLFYKTRRKFAEIASMSRDILVKKTELDE